MSWVFLDHITYMVMISECWLCIDDDVIIMYVLIHWSKCLIPYQKCYINTLKFLISTTVKLQQEFQQQLKIHLWISTMVTIKTKQNKNLWTSQNYTTHTATYNRPRCGPHLVHVDCIIYSYCSACWEFCTMLAPSMHCKMKLFYCHHCCEYHADCYCLWVSKWCSSSTCYALYVFNILLNLLLKHCWIWCCIIIYYYNQ